MSDDLIRRRDVIVTLKTLECLGYIKCKTEGVIKDIEAIPSADRPQGEWINHFDDLFPADSTIECSICHEHQPMGIDENFCPNCGAKMKGADDDNN